MFSHIIRFENLKSSFSLCLSTPAVLQIKQQQAISEPRQAGSYSNSSSWWKLVKVLVYFVLSFLPGHFTHWKCVFSLTFLRASKCSCKQPHKFISNWNCGNFCLSKALHRVVIRACSPAVLCGRECSHTALCTNTHKGHIHLFTPKRPCRDSTNWRHCPSGLCSSWGMHPCQHSYVNHTEFQMLS